MPVLVMVTHHTVTMRWGVVVGFGVSRRVPGLSVNLLGTLRSGIAVTVAAAIRVTQHRLPPLLNLGEGVDLPSAGQTNLLIEYQIHNLSDADFSNSIPAVSESQVLLAQLAPAYGYNPSNVTVFNNKFRNVVFAFLSPERLEILYTNGGLDAVKREIDKLERLHLI